MYLLQATGQEKWTVSLSKATAFSPCRCQPLHLPMLVDWCGDALGVRISSECLTEWINEGPSKKSRLSEPHSSIQLAPKQQTEGLELVNGMMNRTAIGCTLRTGLLGPPQCTKIQCMTKLCLALCSNGVQRAGRQYCQQRTLRKKYIILDCCFFHSS